MKKIKLVGLLIVIAFSSCLQEPEPKQEPLNLDPHHISVEQAIGNMNSAMSQLYTGTRATKGYTIQTLKGKDLRPVGTRSDGEELPENLVYIVNFDNDEGFAVLAADNRLEPVIAITESGNLEINDFIGTENLPREKGIIASLLRNYALNTIDYQLSEIQPSNDTIPLFLANEEVTRDQIWFNLKWHQGPPFNNVCPLKTDSLGNILRAPVGCAAIAVAQIIAYYGVPVPFSFGVYDMGWTQIMSHDYYFHSDGDGTIPHKEYQDPDYIPTSYDSLMYSRLSSILYKIGYTMGSKYNATNTSTQHTRIVTYLNGRGYLSVSAGGTTLREKLIALQNHYGYLIPALVCGTDRNAPNIGHVWVVDDVAFIARHRPGGPQLGRAWMAHCRWGWRYGLGNGYYMEDIFVPYFGRKVTNEYDDIYWTFENGAHVYDFEVNDFFFLKPY